MKDKSVWLIHHKASVGLRSSLNMDGSEYAFAVGVVYAKNVVDAITRLRNHLVDDDMDLVDISKCEMYLPENFVATTEDNEEITSAATHALLTNEIILACSISCEADYMKVHRKSRQYIELETYKV
jgi:hypothetical protein